MYKIKDVADLYIKPVGSDIEPLRIDFLKNAEIERESINHKEDVPIPLFKGVEISFDIVSVDKRKILDLITETATCSLTWDFTIGDISDKVVINNIPLRYMQQGKEFGITSIMRECCENIIRDLIDCKHDFSKNIPIDFMSYLV